MMLALAALLSAVMGASLGLLGGGGSILAVPILLYVLDLTPKEAIAASLLIVGTTSAVSAVRHARAGNVRWRTGLVFGLVAMVGAYGGGLVAQFVAGPTLLMLFAAMMVPTGLAMLRRSKTDSAVTEPHTPSLWKAALEGLIVGAITGLVGAGGGFLVVPALVLFGGLDMRSAVGTSTLVIAMKSFAGFAGHATHVSVDPQIVLWVTGFAVVGALVGVALVPRVDPGRLRQAFGGFVLVMAALMVWQQATPDLLRAVFVDRWPFWAGGAAIGGFVLLLLATTGQALGVSTGFQDACAAPFDPEVRRSWRLPFLLGIVGGGLIAALAAGGPSPTLAMGTFDTLALPFPAKAAVFAAGGVLLGFGARMAGGCTSGHGIVGTALLARSSLLATSLFMVAGFASTHLLFRLVGG